MPPTCCRAPTFRLRTFFTVENVNGGSPDFVAAATQANARSPVLVNAASWGWVQRARLFWVHDLSAGICAEASASQPQPMRMAARFPPSMLQWAPPANLNRSDALVCRRLLPCAFLRAGAAELVPQTSGVPPPAYVGLERRLRANSAAVPLRGKLARESLGRHAAESLTRRM